MRRGAEKTKCSILFVNVHIYLKGFVFLNKYLTTRLQSMNICI